MAMKMPPRNRPDPDSKVLHFDNWTERETEEFFSKFKEWEDTVKSEYSKAVKDEHFVETTSKSSNMKGMLDSLPFKMRRRLMNEYRRIIQFDKHVGEDTPLVELIGGKNRTSRVRIDPTQLSSDTPHPLAFIYNRMFLRADVTDPSGHTIGSNILSSEALRGVVETGGGKGEALKAGSRVFVFDTETTGLPFGSVTGQHYPDIRQISAALMDVDDDGVLGLATLEHDEYYRTSRMQMGHLAIDGKSTPMVEAIQSKYMVGKEFANKTPGAGTDFVESLKPILQTMLDSDYFVGHNVQYDVEQIFSGLQHTSAYRQNIDGFADLLDQTRTHVLSGGRVRDTLHMAQAQLPGLNMAKELSWAENRITAHGLENLMLSTNLPDLLRSDLGSAELLEMIGADRGLGTMHAGEVDTQIEAYLFKYLNEGRIEAIDPRSDSVGMSIRRAVLKSYAPTPLSNIADISDIDETIFERMLEEDGAVRIRGEDGRDLPIRGRPASEVRALLLGEDAPHATFNINPIEQEILSTRRVLTADESIDTMEASKFMGSFDRWTQRDEPYQGFLNRVGSLFKMGERPSAESFEALQEGYARSGLPFAGLSMPERHLTGVLARTSAMSGGGGSILGEAVDEGGRVASDLGLSTFTAWDRYYLSKSNQNITIPMAILEKAEREGVITPALTANLEDESRMLSLSAYGREEKRVGLTYNIGKDDASSLADWLRLHDPDELIDGKTLLQYGIDESALDDIAEFLPTSGVEHGISIARQEGVAGRNAYLAMEDFFQGLLRDRDIMPIRSTFVEREGDRVVAGPAVLNRQLPDTSTELYSRSALADDIRLATRRRTDLTEIMANSAQAQAITDTVSSVDPDVTRKAIDFYQNYKGKAAIGAGLVTAVIGGYYLYKRNQKQDVFDEALMEMPTERQSDYDSYRDEMGLQRAPARRIMDPLATAGIVGNLDRGKIGHTQMGTSGRYSDLYMGAL